MSPSNPGGEDEDFNAKRAQIIKINQDPTLTDDEKRHRIQALHRADKWLVKPEEEEKDLLSLLESEEERINATCAICTELVTRPVTLACQHNICLKCIQSYGKQKTSMRSCAICRVPISKDIIDNPRVNTTMVAHLRMLKVKHMGAKQVAVAQVHRAAIEDKTRPEEAFVTSRAVRSGMANACSGSLKMTCPPDHFGPIGPEFDPRRNRGLVVGDMFPNRMTCRMWNAHLPHVAGIAGQSRIGAQSVVLSGGYVDDVDEGDYFLYTGSGGKNLEGNKRNGAHDRDQEFTRYNMALKKSCEQGLPVRVIRSSKEKRSAYAPKVTQESGQDAGHTKGDNNDDDSDEEDEEEGNKEADGSEGEEEEEEGAEDGSLKMAKAIANNPVRYDGVYRILACWRGKGAENYLVCRYLFVRCDNAPAPWSMDDGGDKPDISIPARALKEIEAAKAMGEDVTYMTTKPAWDYDPVVEEWTWTRPPPRGEKPAKRKEPLEKQIKAAQRDLKKQQQLMKMYICPLCNLHSTRPVYTPCGHLFCLECLKGKFEADDGQRGRANARRSSRACTLRKPCPSKHCTKDLVAFMEGIKVNNVMQDQLASALLILKEKEETVAALERQLGNKDQDPADPAAEKVQQEAPVQQENETEAAESTGGDCAEAAASEDVPMTDATAPEAPSPAAPQAAGTESQPQSDVTAPKSESEGAALQLQGGEGSRWRAEASMLALQHPDFDIGLIAGLLDDQGGDVHEVEAYIKRMKRTQQAPARNSKPRQDGSGAAARGSRRKSKKGRSPAKRPAAEEPEELEDTSGKREEGHEDGDALVAEGKITEGKTDVEMEEVSGARVDKGKANAKPKGVVKGKEKVEVSGRAKRFKAA
ncbi:hypothetical protein Vretifemale_2674 [Volvox reticuliferus]|uniref:RING-type E3 ubiquitin transferase n=1 Tax=Volvox reticuliferus TaxID=1737510 RepID=A0A8J4FF73_9CHLO|nr:hypothetical protein Vretifemale_2674 [Volvox reticuliferus]